ncbi:MAG: alpha-L-arabinofuranosidase C-terminal domain-containing protein, partial [Opitutaceae bacterium]
AGHYSQTFGLGFFEYFQLCEDLGAAPIPIVNCGMCCQARGGPAVSMDELDPFVQDALDLIEFANGPVSSFWGSKRAAMGHPEPFNMKYLGAGNEQWGEACFERYAVFYEALKQRHPEIVLITTSGPHPDDKWWRFAWEKFHSGTPADMVDEHLHRPPHWFLANSDRYDDYTRPGPKVFAGGFAAHDGRRNNLRAALAEAAFMTGLWRNADIVKLAAYAPLFGRHGYAQWTPNLIWFDATRVYGTPSYHVQKMYSLHRPDLALPVKVDYAADQSVPPVFAAAGRDEKTREVVLALVNPHAAPAPVNVHLNGGGRWSEKATATILSGDPADENSLDRPNAVEPRTTFIEIPSPDFEYTIAPHAFVILRLGEERVLTTNTLKHE